MPSVIADIEAVRDMVPAGGLEGWDGIVYYAVGVDDVAYRPAEDVVLVQVRLRRAGRDYFYVAKESFDRRLLGKPFDESRPAVRKLVERAIEEALRELLFCRVGT